MANWHRSCLFVMEYHMSLYDSENYREIMTIEDFLSSVKAVACVDDDGIGQLLRKVSEGFEVIKTNFSPSHCYDFLKSDFANNNIVITRKNIPTEATHVEWFNK